MPRRYVDEMRYALRRVLFLCCIFIEEYSLSLMQGRQEGRTGGKLPQGLEGLRIDRWIVESYCNSVILAHKLFPCTF